ncbi:hypothetical protein ACO0LF_14770 [Undibacterium sp. Di27W]|uniref:hypothetical protein n=1 Tax=Undibacterium sp. Di27W TaxID=3413036 RepID=UPI003BF3D2E7
MNKLNCHQALPGCTVKTASGFALLLAACLAPLAQAQVLPTDVKPTCTTSTPPSAGAPPAPAFAQWFEPAGVRVDGLVKPADSVNFPDASACSFYQWSEQMFLWLVSPTPKNLSGGDRIFLSSAFYGVSPEVSVGGKPTRTFIPQDQKHAMKFSPMLTQLGPHNLPIGFDKSGKLVEVLPPPAGNKRLLQLQTQLKNGSLGENAVQSIKANVNGGLKYQDAAGNDVDVTIGQAGGNVLMAQNGSLVYYSIVTNDLYAYFFTQNAAADPSKLQYPTTAEELAKVADYAKKSKFKPLAAPEALAMEIKMSWIETTGFDDATKKKFITIKAEVPKVDTNNIKSANLQNSPTRKVELALVGMHVVGSAKGNPELIWATFEHDHNTPNAEYSYFDVNGATKTVPQDTKGKWLFSQDGATGPFDQRLYDTSSTTITCLDKSNPCVVKPNNTLRWKPWGAAANQNPRQADPTHPGPVITPPESNTDIISINQSIISQLADGDVRKNYRMIGSTWTTGGRAPDKASAGAINQVGTSMLANTTMETVFQGVNVDWLGDVSGNPKYPSLNCFACHSTNTVNTSHLWTKLTPLPTAHLKAKSK